MQDAPFAAPVANDPGDHAVKPLIAGYYGAGNAGDEAILAGMLAAIRPRIPGLDPIVVSADPASTAAAHHVRSVSKLDKPAVLAAVRDCDFVLLGGGGLLQDYWPMDIGNFFSHPAAHPGYASYAALAALYDKPLFLYAVGVGPLSTPEGRLQTRRICDQARLITVRDPQSQTLLTEIGVDPARIHVTADPAFLFPLPPPAQSPTLGVALRNWNIGVDSALWQSEVARALDAFPQKISLPFDRDDLAVAGSTVAEPAGDPSALAAALAGCRVVLAMRYHAALFAIRYGIKVVGLAYDPKVRHLLTAAGCEDYVLDLPDLRAEDLAALLQRALQDPRRPAADALIAAAAQTAELVVDAIAHPQAPPPSATRAWLDELSAAASVPDDIKAAIAERRSQLPPSPLYDVICFPGIEWNFRWMRAQQLMSRFADRGHRVFFLSTAAFLPPSGPPFAARCLRDNVWEIRLAVPYPLDVYSGDLPEDLRRAIVEDLSALARDFSIGPAVSILHLPTWTSAAQDLRARLSWPLVYDCMDDWSGFAWMPDLLLDRETELVRQADLTITTAQKLWDKWSPLNPRTILARNAADIDHFQNARSPVPIDLPSSRPIVGFFGAIDSWFDVELVHHAATQRPDYFFALIGAVYDAPVEPLQHLPNVRFYGHQPYAALPACLHRFDACIIPFKINTVTQATDPVKFYEYLAQAKPVVATPLPELEIYRELLYIAETPADFLRHLDTALTENDPPLRSRRLAAATANTWITRYQQIQAAIQAIPTQPQPTRALASLTPNPQPPASEASRRILFACPVFILGGVEVILRNRAVELLRRGWQVRLVALEDAGGQAMFEADGIDSRICPGDEDLARELTDFQPDWIVSLDTPAILPIARQAAPHAALVYEVHSTYPHTLAPLVGRQFLEGVRGILVPSPSQAARIRALLPADLPIRVVPNALGPGFFEDSDPPEAPPHPIVLWVGRLDSLKNWRAFLDLAAVLRARTEARFQLVSGGPFDETDAAELRQAAADPANRLSWIREVDHTRMPALYRAAAQSGGCMVSTSAAESFGMAVLEAMACGCPVVAPDIEGLRDLVRHGETGRLYPPGDLAAASIQILDTLHDTPEHRLHLTEAARLLAGQFSPAAAATRFVDALAVWSSLNPLPQPPSPASEARRILAAHPDARKIVIFPPSIPWDAGWLSDRPQQWATALAGAGCLVFYNDPQRLAAFTEVSPRLFLANVALETYELIDHPVVLAGNSGLGHLDRFRNPVVVYEYPGHASADPEWLARAAVAFDGQTDIAACLPTLLAALENPAPLEDNPLRLKALLAWRERQVDRLEAQLRERDRPAVDTLHGAVAEQKRILGERDKGIAFLRRELAARDHIISEREEAIRFLQSELDHFASMLATHDALHETQEHQGRKLQDEVGSLHRRVEFLEHEIALQKTILAVRDENLELLRGELEACQQIVAAREEGIQFLRQEIADLDHAIADRDRAIADRDQAAAAQGQIVAARDEGIRFLRAELAALGATVRDLESRLPWWRRPKKAEL